ncbi:MAG: DUF4293 family protein [Muribaculaceae bacterium]|nr:DUF4293 family protein [Muribaculaceae bacterium]
MVIQRWQSLYLLIASLFIGLFCYMPMASLVDNSELSMCQFPIYLTLNVLIGILLLISIFLYKNLARQKTVVKICMMLNVASIITGMLIMYNMWSEVIEWNGPVLLVVAVLAITLGAYRHIVADERLLKSYDRIR